MQDITISLEQIYWGLLFIVALGGAVAVLAKVVRPFKAMKQTLADKADKADFDALKAEFTQLKSYQDTDHGKLKDLEKGNEVICKCLLALTDHELTNNSVDKLKAAKDEMQNYLIKK